jgi:predicted flap endonuclease-1-like 5' DNA nuclease
VLYLVTEIWLSLLAAAALGVAIGWAVRRPSRDIAEQDAEPSAHPVERTAPTLNLGPEETTEASAKLAELAQRAERLQAQLAEKAAAAETATRERGALANELKQAKASGDEIKAKFEKTEAELTTSREESQRAVRERAEAVQRTHGLENEVMRLRHAADQAVRERNEATQRLGALNSEFTALRQSTGATEQARMQLVQRVAGLESEMTAARNVLASGESEKQRLVRRIATLEAELDRARTAGSGGAALLPGRITPTVGTRPLGLTEARGSADELGMLVGLDARSEASLNQLGIYHFWQIAEWNPENVAWMNAILGAGGRIEREQWVEQSRVLVNEGVEAFQRRFMQPQPQPQPQPRR